MTEIRKISYTRMDAATTEDHDIIVEYCNGDEWPGADIAIGYLEQLKEDDDAHPWQIDRYQHSLQTATRAQRDGADEEMIVAALLHDIGDVIAPYDHSAASAAILRPFVSDDVHWVVAHHGLFQTYYYNHLVGKDRNERDIHKGHRCYQMCVDFCENWDQRAFDPDYDTLPLAAFEPMVRRIFSKPRWGAV